MRRWTAIAKATALEILSEPLSLLVMLTALMLTTLAPALHFHKFGEATRMARDSGFSALFICGAVIAIFGTIRSFRREIETGTAQMALTHPVSRHAFVFSKIAGSAIALLVFSLTVSAQTCVIVKGAEIGGVVALRNCDIAKLWGPSFALGMAVIVLPLVIGAVLNRFFDFRFVPTAFALQLMFAFGAALYRFDWQLISRMIPAQVLVFALLTVYLASSAAFAVRFKTNVAVSAVLMFVIAGISLIGNYYLPEALSNGGRIPWSYVAMASAALLPALAAFGALAVCLFNERDIG